MTNKNFKTILVSGGAGFIGSCFIKLLLEQKNKKVINVDALTYAGNLNNLKKEQQDPNYKFVYSNIADEKAIEKIFEGNNIEAIVNFAAETHVDRSIVSPMDFVRTNIVGTSVLLEQARKRKIRFLQVSTDEVYGSLCENGLFCETTPLDPSSPYSASKASADMLVLSYFKTFGVDVIVTRCSNNYGGFQNYEKLIPKSIINAILGNNIKIYGDGLNVRDWLHVQDHCEAILFCLEKATGGEVFNIGANNEKNNLEIVHAILNQVGGKSKIEFVEDRLGHDRRYAIDSNKLQGFGWKSKIEFKQGLEQTIDWYIKNQWWWENKK